MLEIYKESIHGSFPLFSTHSQCLSQLLSPSHPHTDMMMVTPINDLHGWEPGSLVKGERLMRCKLASTHRLFDLYGWAQISHTCLTVSSALNSNHGISKHYVFSPATIKEIGHVKLDQQIQKISVICDQVKEIVEMEKQQQGFYTVT